MAICPFHFLHEALSNCNNEICRYCYINMRNYKIGYQSWSPDLHKTFVVNLLVINLYIVKK